MKELQTYFKTFSCAYFVIIILIELYNKLLKFIFKLIIDRLPPYSDFI